MSWVADAISPSLREAQSPAPGGDKAPVTQLNITKPNHNMAEAISRTSRVKDVYGRPLFRTCTTTLRVPITDQLGRPPLSAQLTSELLVADTSYQAPFRGSRRHKVGAVMRYSNSSREIYLADQYQASWDRSCAHRALSWLSRQYDLQLDMVNNLDEISIERLATWVDKCQLGGVSELRGHDLLAPSQPRGVCVSGRHVFYYTDDAQDAILYAKSNTRPHGPLAPDANPSALGSRRKTALPSLRRCFNALWHTVILSFLITAAFRDPGPFVRAPPIRYHSRSREPMIGRAHV